MTPALMGELVVDSVERVVANDYSRGSFTAGGRVLNACFAGDHIVARLLDSDRAVAIDSAGNLHDLDVGPGYIVPAADSWLTVDDTRLRRWRLAR